MQEFILCSYMKAYRESIIVGRFVWSLLPLSADTRFRGPPCYPVLFASGKLHMDHSMLTHRSRYRLSPVMRANLIFLSYSLSDEYELTHQYIVNALYYSSSQRHKSVEFRLVTKPWHCEDVYYYTCTYTRLHKMTPPKLKKLKT